MTKLVLFAFLAGCANDADTDLCASDPVGCLPGASFDCSWHNEQNGILTSVPHVWQFEADTYSTDLPEAVTAAFAGGNELAYLSNLVDAGPPPTPIVEMKERSWWDVSHTSLAVDALDPTMTAVVGFLFALSCSRTPPAIADEDPPAIQQPYLGSWQCRWRYSRQTGSLESLLDNEVAHTWMFGADTFDTDFIDRMLTYGNQDRYDKYAAVGDHPWFGNDGTGVFAHFVPSESRRLRPVAHDAAQLLLEDTSAEIDVDHLIRFSTPTDNPDALAIFLDQDFASAILCDRAAP